MTVLARVLLLASRRATWLAAALAAAAFLLAPFLPLAGVPGFESSLWGTWVLAIAAGVFGVAAAKQEIELEGKGRLRRATSLSSTLQAFAAACAPALALLGLLVAWTWLHTLWGPSCSATFGLPWYPLLPLPTLLLSSASGLALGFAFAGRRASFLTLALLLVASLGTSLLPLWSGPQVFFYDHFFGYVPGPLYDEQVRIEGPLLAFRALTLAWTCLALGLAALLRRRWRRGADRPAIAPALAIACAVALVGWGHGKGADLGFEQSNDTVEAALGGRMEGAHCVLIHPRELQTDEVRRLLVECDHRMEELREFFGLDATESRKATVFLHRSTEEKRRLVGAARTQFAKPWLSQVHVDRRGFPHPVLHHELAHVVTADVGRGPFGVSARLFGLLPLPGLIEGAAVAADWPGGSLTVHQAARAMGDLGLAPDLRKILSAWGFWSQPASRAYTAAGSFVRWLVETHGADAFAQAYRTGSFSGIEGGLDPLIASWQAFLAKVDLPEEALAVAEARFRRGSILGQSCAREVASLREEARAIAASGDAPRAAALYARLAKLQPDDPSFRLGEAMAWAQAQDVDRLLELAGDADNRGDPRATRARLWILVGDGQAQRGEVGGAEDAYQRAQALAVGEDEARSLAVRHEVSRDRYLARRVIPYLNGGGVGDLFAIRDLLDYRREWGTGWYLVGRRLHQLGHHPSAMNHLHVALRSQLPEALRREAEKLYALSALIEKEHEVACPAFEELAARGSAGERVEAADLAGLCNSGWTDKPGP